MRPMEVLIGPPPGQEGAMPTAAHAMEEKPSTAAGADKPAGSTSDSKEKAKSDGGWVTVGKDASREVQLDRGGIINSDAGTKIAWVRIVMQGAEGGRDYAGIKAMNRFDCNGRSFVTVKRVYLNAQNQILREESVKDEQPVLFSAGSVDERLWREVCDPAAGGGAAALQDVAARVEQALAAAGAKTSIAPDGSTVVRMGDGKKVTTNEKKTALPPRRHTVSTPHAYTGNVGHVVRGAVLCRRGKQQSPIDLTSRGAPFEAEPLVFDYQPTPFQLHAARGEVRLQVPTLTAGPELFFRGNSYRLTQMALRWPGTRINGQAMDVDVQLFHKSANGTLLMLVVPLRVSTGSEDHPALAQILSTLPFPQAVRSTRTVRGTREFDFPSLVPYDGAYFLYQGSLPDAPCTEGVTWLVMREPMPMSAAQLVQLRERFGLSAGRTAQPTNGRTVLAFQ